MAEMLIRKRFEKAIMGNLSPSQCEVHIVKWTLLRFLDAVILSIFVQIQLKHRDFFQNSIEKFLYQ